VAGGSSPSGSSSGNVGEGRHAERPAGIAVRFHERREEVDLVLASDPSLVQLLERVEEARAREFPDPDRVEQREIRSASLGDGVCQYLVQRGARDGNQVDLELVLRGLEDELPPGAFGRDHDAHLRLIGPASQPMRIDEGAAPPLPKHDPVFGELREGAAHRRSADRVEVAQLVLRRQPLARSVVAGQDLLDEERLELDVEGNGLPGID
jgi:hypothetical protein